MHKIDSNTATANNEFTDGNGTIPDTNFNAAWCNSVQREICNAVEKSGQTLDPNNDEQLWNAIVRMGIKAFYADGDFTVPSDYKGAIVLFCEAKNFTISALRSDSLIFIVPMWGTVIDKITITYQQWTYDIPYKSGMMAVADNGFDHYTGLFGSCFPLSGNGAVYNFKRVNAGTVQATTYLDSVESFEYSDDDAEGLQDWQKFQLASRWTNGQVKKILCTNAEDSGTDVIMYLNSQGTWKRVMFYPGSYREFIFTGETYSSGSYVFAVLALNGNPA